MQELIGQDTMQLEREKGKRGDIRFIHGLRELTTGETGITKSSATIKDTNKRRLGYLNMIGTQC